MLHSTSMPLKHLQARARAGVHLARALVCNRLDRVTPPSWAHVCVTWRCNLRCRTCSVWKEELFPEMGTADFVAVLRKLPFLDVIKITGGEPFLRDDLDVLVETLYRHTNPAMLHIVSNGTMPDRMVKLVEKLGRPSLTIRISLEGRGDTHNRLRGRPWAYEKTWAAVEALAPLRRRHGFHLGINYNLCEDTLEDLPSVMEYCRANGIDLVPGVAVFPFLEDRYEDVTNRVEMRDGEAFLARYAEVLDMQAGLSRWETALARRQALRAVEELVRGVENLRFGCRELYNLLYLLPDGNVATCGLKHKAIGSLLDQSFDDIWFGPAIQPFRKEVKECGGCLQLSVKMASRLYNGAWRP